MRIAVGHATSLFVETKSDDMRWIVQTGIRVYAFTQSLLKHDEHLSISDFWKELALESLLLGDVWASDYDASDMTLLGKSMSHETPYNAQEMDTAAQKVRTGLFRLQHLIHVNGEKMMDGCKKKEKKKTTVGHKHYQKQGLI